MVPKRLKEAREAAGLSQEKLSQLIGIEGANSRSRLSSYEVGRTEPPFSLVVKIAKALGYPEYYFYVIDDETAKRALQAYRTRIDPDENPHHGILLENQKLRSQRDEAQKLVKELERLLKALRSSVDL